MRTLHTVLLAGAAALALTGGVGPAEAQSPQMHTMTVALPGGGVAQIRYSGNVAPQVSIGEAPWTAAVFAPMPALFGPGSPFAEMERLSAAMDRQAAALLQETSALAAGPLATGPVNAAAALTRLPPGSHAYTAVSTLTGNGVCTRSVEITRRNGQAPKVVTHTSGNCDAAPDAGVSTRQPAAAPSTRVPMIETRNTTHAPYAGLIREATWQH
jgi:hypothetical protein